jgi:hypothetical protein
MRNKDYGVAVAAASVVALACGLGILAGSEGQAHKSTQQVCQPFEASGVQGVNCQPCEEDQPCWNCATMGNHVCGSPGQPLMNQQLIDMISGKLPFPQDTCASQMPLIPCDMPGP